MSQLLLGIVFAHQSSYAAEDASGRILIFLPHTVKMTANQNQKYWKRDGLQ